MKAHFHHLLDDQPGAEYRPPSLSYHLLSSRRSLCLYLLRVIGVLTMAAVH